MKLTGSQRKYLRGQAHHLEPVVIVGQHGVSEGLVAEVGQALDHHELIKIRFNEYRDQKKELTAEVADQLGAAVVGTIGHVAILYRPHPESDKRKYEKALK